MDENSSHPSDESRLEDLLAEALAAIEEHGRADLDALCEDCPQLRPELEQALADAGAIGVLHKATRDFDPLEGRVLDDRYRLEHRVGAGAMGIVYEAFDEQLARSVAVKLLRPEIFADDGVEARLEREAKSLAQIRHDSVVKIFDRGRTSEGQPYFVMDLLRGTTAAELLAERERRSCGHDSPSILSAYASALGDDVRLRENDVRQSVQWIIEAADAIAAAHDAGIVHRDLKPSNLFVESTGRAVVLDFGIVSLSAKATLSLHESSIGTPAYMAPEQMRRESEPDARTDVYGLTATLYHLVTGHAPFEGTPHQVLATLQRREPPPADEHRPGLPRDLLAILEKGMATSPSNRYAGARALRDDLRAFLEYRPVMARRASAVERLVRRVWRSPAMKASGAVLALVAMAAVSYVWIVAAQRNRNEAWDRDSITVPPSLLAGRPSFREVSAVTKSDRVANLLDRLVENGSEPLTSTAWRAIHRIDRGQLAAAAADLGSLAGTAGNAPLTAWAASRLRQGHVPDLTIESLPEDAAPTGTIDLIVGAMLQLRGNRLDAAVPRELLDRIPNDERPRGFHEMHFMCRLHELVRSREPRDTRLANARELATDVERYIGTRGVMSAVCGHVLGNALSAQRRHFEGEDVLQRTMQLTPEDPAPRIVLGGILYELGNYGPAITVLEQAVALQPRTIQSREQLVKSLAWLERYEEADKVLSQIPYDDSPRMQGQRSRLVGTLAYIRAAHANAGADRDSVSAFAREAKLHFEEASRLGIRQATFESAVCDWILTPENATRSRLILLAAREALNPYRLRSLAAQLNDPLDAEETQAFRTFLLQQAELRLAEDATHTPH